MWKKHSLQCIGLACALSLVSCDRVQSLVSDITGGGVPNERREGIQRVHSATISEAKMWLAEPNVLVVLDFYSASCPRCAEMSPSLNKMAKKYGGKSAVMKLNVGEPGETAKVAVEEYEITQTPELKFFLNGKELKSVAGAQSDEELDALFEKYTGKISDDKEFVMKEGVMPGQKAQAVEEMMVRVSKNELPQGISRVKISGDEKVVTDKLPSAILSGGGAPPASESINTTYKPANTKKEMTATERAMKHSLGKSPVPK
ncbi:thioredoxin family protein [Rubritalea sp.]|uniref:thioredoxin family protein n=1 Tax=Rubritalea sp. TaxID=2109375 RepID=UPI003EF53D9E